MASRLLLRPLHSRFTLLTAATTTSLLLLHPSHQQKPLLCDSPPPPPSLRERASGFGRQEARPLQRRWRGDVLRQMSSGSLLGLACGVAVGVFSKPLAVLIGLLVFGLQVLESRGISLVPYSRLQGYFRGVDVRSLLQKNVAFKLSFGATFALAGFAKF